MSQYIKDKNFIIITLPPLQNSTNERVYRYDINTGALYGKRNTPLQNAPSGFGDFVRGWRCGCGWVAFYLDYWAGSHNASFILHLNNDYIRALQIADRLDALGIHCNWCAANADRDLLYFLGEHFSEFVKYYQNIPADERRVWALHYFKIYWNSQMFAQTLGVKVDEHCPEDLISLVYNLVKNCDGEQAFANNLPHIKMYRQIVAWYMKGAYYLGEQYGHRHFQSIFRDAINAAKKMGMTEFPKGDAIRVCQEVLRTYEAKKQELDNKRLADFQRKKWSQLSFEYGDYQVIIPTTAVEFEKEAEQQHNCVFSMYLQRVVEGRTHVVFVRNKNDLAKSVVTCEVMNDGIIRQFLAQHNSTPSEELLEFRKAYQVYLNKNW